MNEPVKIKSGTTPASSSVHFALSPAVATTVQSFTIGAFDHSRDRTVAAQQRAYEKAIFWHIRAVRAMGRKNINTIEISRALTIPLAKVELAISALKDRGIEEAT